MLELKQVKWSIEYLVDRVFSCCGCDFADIAFMIQKDANTEPIFELFNTSHSALSLSTEHWMDGSPTFLTVSLKHREEK